MVFGSRAELGHCCAERAEVVHHGLVNENVPVGKEKNPLHAARLPQPPDDLKRRVGLFRSRSP